MKKRRRRTSSSANKGRRSSSYKRRGPRRLLLYGSSAAETLSCPICEKHPSPLNDGSRTSCCPNIALICHNCISRLEAFNITGKSVLCPYCRQPGQYFGKYLRGSRTSFHPGTRTLLREYENYYTRPSQRGEDRRSPLTSLTNRL